LRAVRPERFEAVVVRAPAALLLESKIVAGVAGEPLRQRSGFVLESGQRGAEDGVPQLR
jgi:hypothetical protein